MKSISVSQKIEDEELSNIFAQNIGSVSYSRGNRSGNVDSIFLCGTKFFLRTNDTIGFVLYSFYNGQDQKIVFGRIGGGSGLLNIRMGAGNKVEESILSSIQQAAERIGAIVSSDEPTQIK